MGKLVAGVEHKDREIEYLRGLLRAFSKNPLDPPGELIKEMVGYARR
jgi:hypothetical protein